MITNTAAAKPPPSARVNSESVASRSRAPARAAPDARGSRRSLLSAGRASAQEGEGHDDQRQGRRGDDPQRDGVLAAGDPERDREREGGARDRLGDDQQRVERQPVAAGEEAAGEVAGPVGGDRRRRRSRRGSRCRPAGRPGSAPRSAIAIATNPTEIAELDQRRHPDRPRVGLAGGEVLGDRAREQLLDRPLQGRDEDEHRRPQHGDLAVVLPGELVRGEREVEVGDQPGEPDADREQARAAAVARRLARLAASPRLGLPWAEKPSGPRRSWLTDQSIGPRKALKMRAAMAATGTETGIRAPAPGAGAGRGRARAASAPTRWSAPSWSRRRRGDRRGLPRRAGRPARRARRARGRARARQRSRGRDALRDARALRPQRPPAARAPRRSWRPASPRVVYASEDPTEKASGRGPGILRDGGVKVELASGAEAAAARLLNQPFRKRARTGRPLVTYKAAMTLDGRVAAPGGDSRWISARREPRAGAPLALGVRRGRRRDRHRARRRPAADRPPRRTGEETRPEPAVPEPVRVVFDSHAACRSTRRWSTRSTRRRCSSSARPRRPAAARDCAREGRAPR